MTDTTITTIVDYYLDKWIKLDVNKRPGRIDPLMVDINQNANEEWRRWFPIDSKVNDEEIDEFERRLGHKLPPDYIIFLKHKHFYDLYISEASFCPHPVNAWRKELSEMIFDGYPQKYLIESGLIPFANWSDWGHLCFDTNVNDTENNYPIVIWDHETPYDNQYFSTDFKSMMAKLDKEDKESRSEI